MPLPDPPVPAARIRDALLLGSVLLLAVIGWQLFWFLTDDAFISFRYISNDLAGWGLTWNPPPFRPVEGYTSLLWVVLLKWVWILLGVKPPDSANILSLLLSLGTLLLAFRFLRRMAVPGEWGRWTPWVGFLALLGVAGNRTFLAWASSGLETALFDLCLVGWVMLCFRPPAGRDLRWGFLLAASASLAALARPDGLLAAAVTAPLLALEGRRRGGGRFYLAGLPLLAVPAHLLWRFGVYGEWLPNPFFAKVGAPWPEAGARYLGSFIIEYGLWVWLLLAGAYVVRRKREGGAGREAGAAAVAVVLAQAAWYTLMVGGDYFEFRVYRPLIPLAFLSAVFLAGRLTRRGWAAALLVGTLLAASFPIPWLHWWKTRDLSGWERTHELHLSLAEDFPAPLRPAVGLWDRWQGWLIAHWVGLRHQEHKAMWEMQAADWPPRSWGERNLPWEERQVLVFTAVGYPAWSLPGVAVIDLYGLNDHVLARTEVPPDLAGPVRRMAHQRNAPRGYIEELQPTLWREGGRFRRTPRGGPFDEERVRAAEARYWDGIPWSRWEGWRREPVVVP